MKTCPDCGRQYPDDAGFCMVDGIRLEAPRAPESPTVVMSPPKQQLSPTQEFSQPVAPAPAPEPEPEPQPAPAPRTRVEAPRPVVEEFEPAPKPALAPPKRPDLALADLPLAGRDDGGRSKRRVSGSFSRIRNPWLKSLEDGAPNTQEFERSTQAAARSAQRGGAAEGGQRPFSDTLWFMNGVQPDDVRQLEDEGTVEVDDGHYVKKKDLPEDVRRRYTLEEADSGGPAATTD